MPDRGRPFQKGVSCNPGGRPKVDPEVKALFDEMTPEASKTLGETMRKRSFRRRRVLQLLLAFSEIQCLTSHLKN
jgi:hypothetical protein